MAKTLLNGALGGLHGNLDGWVYRTFEGQTVVQTVGTRTKPRTEKEAGGNERFRRATLYSTFLSPEKRALYQAAAPGRPWNNLSIRDYMCPPVIDEVTIRTVPGGLEIRILAHDDFKVCGVEVAIRAPRKVPLARGEAELQPDGSWRYCTALVPTAERPLLAEVTVRDLPDHASVQCVPLPLPPLAVLRWRKKETVAQRRVRPGRRRPRRAKTYR